MKICHVIFSTNRLQYLYRSLKSLDKIDYCDHDVDLFLIDDYPLNRKNEDLELLAKKFNIHNLILNKENLGISKNIQNFFDIINNHNYDYIIHQEDDVELLYKINVNLLIDILNIDKTLAQIQLQRNSWYKNEPPVCAKTNDIIFNEFRYEKENAHFRTMFSLYPSWICREPILEETKNYPNEGSIASYLYKKYNLVVASLKTKDGGYLINHFGDFTQGKRAHESDSDWDRFKHFDPNKKYCSKTGKEII